MPTIKLIRHKSGRTSYLEGGTGAPILFLHGFPGSAYSWETAAHTLLEKNPGRYRLIIPDLLGFGESDSTGDDWYMEGQARAIADLLKRLDIPDLYLAAHDFGGPIALTLLRLHPELTIRKLMLSATNLFTDTPIPLPLRSAGIPVLGDLVYKAMAGSPFGFRMMYQFAAVNKKAVCWEDFRRHITPHGMSSTARIFQHSIADLPGNYRSIEEFASQIEIPTLIVWGDSDPFFPVPVAMRSAEAIRNATLKIFKQTGHFVPEERAAEVADELAVFFQ
ncbi:MAG TPA: alpha/beta hydrolase [Anaerolineales bacterium]|nr:alpha/beta hydrolase [Anaerolineales bacterium]